MSRIDRSEEHELHAVARNQIGKILLRVDVDVVVVTRSGQRTRERAIGDERDLRGREGTDVKVRMSREEGPEVVKIPTRGAYDDRAIGHCAPDSTIVPPDPASAASEA